MSANSAKVQSIIENTFTSAIKRLTNNEAGSVVSDLYVQADAESGELQIFDEDENLLGKVVIFDWVNSEEESFDKKASATLKSVLTLLTAKEAFAHSRFLKPFSVSLVDEDFVVIEELLFIDDNTFRLDDPLLKDLDEDLDNFLEGLLSDLPK
jgi:CRISPR/Cas system-associated protein Cas7 (RAMP superfamily)